MNTPEDTPETEVLQAALRARVYAEYERFQAWRKNRREKIIAEETARRQPGILDRISTCPSREAAFLMFHEFLDTANAASQKTINKANRLLSTLDFPQP